MCIVIFLKCFTIVGKHHLWWVNQMHITSLILSPKLPFARIHRAPHYFDTNTNWVTELFGTFYHIIICNYNAIIIWGTQTYPASSLWFMHCWVTGIPKEYGIVLLDSKEVPYSYMWELYVAKMKSLFCYDKLTSY